MGFYSIAGTPAVTNSLFTLIGNSGTADVVGPTNYGWLCAAPGASGNCLDTTGSGARGTIETVLPYNFLANTAYTFSISITRWNDTVNGGELSDANLRINIGSIRADADGMRDGLLSEHGRKRPINSTGICAGLRSRSIEPLRTVAVWRLREVPCR